VPRQLAKLVGGGGRSPASAPGGRKPTLVWFRSDLRLHDNEALAAACAAATSVLPVYIFDPREYGKARWRVACAPAAGHMAAARALDGAVHTRTHVCTMRTCARARDAHTHTACNTHAHTQHTRT
jgi:hypothetical protein